MILRHFIIAILIVVGTPAMAQIAPSGTLDRPTQETANGGGIIPFAVGTSNLGQGAKAKLDPLIAWLKAHPERKARLAGHADEPVTDEFNLALGDKRANAVLTYMVAHGIEPSRLSTVTFGRSRPLSPDMKQNSRVEVILGQ
jgi:peptidoglycan-associated lipoprotein